MRAVVVEALGPPDTHRVRELADPSPDEGEVVVAAEWADVNYPDLLMVDGRYQFRPPLPFVPGKCAAGTIAAVGAGVDRFEAGERVLAQVEFGAFAQKLAVAASAVFPLPDALELDVAAALGVTYQTAHFALQRRGQMRQGDTVLVLGASGGVGVATVQLAKAMGAKTVIGTARSQGKAATVREAGADAVILTERDDLKDALRAEVLDATAGHGADVVVDAVGGAVGEAALRAVAWEGRYVIVGFVAAIPNVRANYLLVKNIAALGVHWSDYREREPDAVLRAHEEIVAFALAGKLSPIISARYPMERFAEALDALGRGAVRGKVLLELGR